MSNKRVIDAREIWPDFERLPGLFYHRKGAYLVEKKKLKGPVARQWHLPADMQHGVLVSVNKAGKLIISKAGYNHQKPRGPSKRRRRNTMKA